LTLAGAPPPGGYRFSLPQGWSARSVAIDQQSPVAATGDVIALPRTAQHVTIDLDHTN
jgi:hypothetical protein